MDMTNQPSRLQAVAAAEQVGRRDRGARRIELAEAATDAELLRASRCNPDAFRELYNRYSERLFGYFARRTGSEDSALELTAETFSRVWVMRERFEDQRGGSIAPWLFGIARNVLLMSVRRGVVDRRTATRLGVLDRLDIEGPIATPEPGWSEGADELLNTLPLSQREALRLRIIDELAYDQVAEVLGTSRAAARVRVHRGLASLRQRLSNSKENH
jgi:RNA polymerase sigma-70 factor (ECF subfamily)